MKKIIQSIVLFSLLAIMLITSPIHALDANIIGLSNLTDGEQKAGPFEISGVAFNDGQISKIAVKTGIGPWENAEGIESWKYKVNTRRVFLGYEKRLDSSSGQMVKTSKYGPYYGDLQITVGAFKADGVEIAQKTVTVKVIPEKPVTDILPGVYGKWMYVPLKAAPELTIYYTTDGSDPKDTNNTNRSQYNGAIYVYQNKTIKAVSQSKNGLYSEVTTLDLQIDSSVTADFWIQYYEDQALLHPLSDPAYLKAGTYYLKIISTRGFSSGPFIDIDAPGASNDVSHAGLVSVCDCVYRYTRVVSNNAAATGDTQEVITISGTDDQWYSVNSVSPINSSAKAAYLDTQPPAQGSVALTGGVFTTADPTPKFTVNSTGADWMRFALSESGLAAASWVEYATLYDGFDISAGGNGNKTIWAEFKDQAGNIQTLHAFTSVYYDNSTLSFDIEYFADAGLLQTLGNNPYLKAGTYYLKITANQELNYNPSVQISAEGWNNDVSYAATAKINPRVFYYTRTIVADGEAIGAVQEQITIEYITPSNTGSKAAYTDTQAPTAPTVTGIATTGNLKPTWSWNNVAEAIRYRYSFTDGSLWAETMATSFTPDTNLTAGSTYTLYVQAGDQAGNWSASGSFSTTINIAPEINVKQGTTDIPNGTGSFDFGDVSLFSCSDIAFTIENTGVANLSLTGTPQVQISGGDASYFNVTSQPASPVSAGGNTTFSISFAPGNSLVTRTATVSIANSDTAKNPYTFTVTGTGSAQTLTLGSWASGNISKAGEIQTYSFDATPGNSYAINWDDSYQGSAIYTCDVKVSAYRQDLTTTYSEFSDIDSGFTTPRTITAQDSIVYIKVAGYSSSSTGTFALKASLVEPAINIKQGATDIANGTGSYNFGDVSVLSSGTATFTIENTGNADLNLTGSPMVQLSGADAASFSVTAAPDSPVASGSNTTFMVNFIPSSAGIKTATVSIANNDNDMNPYTFTVVGTGTVDTLTLGSWMSGAIESYKIKTYCFNTIPGSVYAINWDDSFQGSGNYNCDIQVSAYRQDLTTTYFNGVDSGYISPQSITALDSIVYLKVAGYNDSYSGSFALKVTSAEPAINVKQDATHIPKETGSYYFGSVLVSSSVTTTFTIENTGTINLSLTGSPKAQLSGADAASFSVTAQPASPVAPGNNTTFSVSFSPTGAGTKTATISIINNDSDMNPYTFTVSGNGAVAGEPAINVKEGTTHIVNGTGTYNFGNILVSASGTATFTVENTGTTDLNLTGSPLVQLSGADAASFSVTSQPAVSTVTSGGSTTFQVSFTPAGAGTKTATISITNDDTDMNPYSFTVSGNGAEPVINLKQGTTHIVNGTGSFDFGSILVSSSGSATFTIENTGSADLNLTGSPIAQLSGADAAFFSITAQPAVSTVTAGTNTTFSVSFNPSESGAKTATISIANGDSDMNPYTFTITGTGVAAGEPAINVKQETTFIANGIGSYNFGNVTVSSSSNVIFTVENTGTTDLNLTGSPKAQLSGADATSFSVATQPVSPVAPGGNTSFIVSFIPSSGGAKTVTISIANNDSDMNPYTFTLSGTGIIPTEPVINVKQGTTDIAKGTGSYDYGSIAVSSSSSITFTVENTGNADLNLTGSPKIQLSGTGAASFSVTAQPASPVASGTNTTFTVCFTPASVGVKTATVSIINNDTDKTPYTFTVTGTGLGEPIINVKQGTTSITSGTGSYTYSNTSVFSSSSVIFTIQNTGSANLNLTDSPIVKINGAGASSFSVTAQPTVSTVAVGGSTTFTVSFTPIGSGAKTATVSIASNDTDKTPFTFSITGTGVATALTPGSGWYVNSISAGQIKAYSFNLPVESTFVVLWDDTSQGSYSYTGNVKVSAYRPDDLSYTYFSDVDNGYSPPWNYIAWDNTVYLKVQGINSGSFAIKVYLNEPAMSVKQNTTTMSNAIGYNFGTVSILSSSSANFTVENSGPATLYLDGTPKVQISGTDASCFSVTAQPAASVTSGSPTSFNITFAPNGGGAKTATVSISNNDKANNPYTFTVSGTGNGTITPLTLGNNFNSGYISAGQAKIYSFSATSGKSYLIAWDDYMQGSGYYDCDVKVTAYRADMATGYFYDIDSGWTTPKIITALDNIVYIKVAGFDSSEWGYFAIKAVEYAPVINVKQGTGTISNGGSCDFGSFSIFSNIKKTFTIENNGASSLSLTGAPMVQISGTDASSFSVTAQPYSPVTAGGSTTFDISFNPVTVGAKTATVTVSNDDNDKDPYNFTITGTGTFAAIPLTLSSWTTGSTAADGEAKIYSFAPTPGKVYSIRWDDAGNGSGDHDLDIKVSAFRQDLTTTYFTNVESGYTTPQTITAQDNVVYLKAIMSTDFGIGSFAFYVNLVEPVISVMQGVVGLPNGTGSYDFGKVLPNSTKTTTFMVKNTGTGDLNLTGTPKVSLSGADAAYFTVMFQPASPIAPYDFASFDIKFSPLAIGTKTATVSITNDDPDETPYTFTITGTGAKPVINLKQGVTNIPSGTGSYDYGDVTVFSNSDTIFTIENTGNDPLTLNGVPTVNIEGADAAYFSVASEPSGTVAAGGSTTFTLRYSPVDLVTRTATISIINNDTYNDPYTFTITGAGILDYSKTTDLTLGNWTSGNISTAGEIRYYTFSTTPGKLYTVTWDDSVQGSATYNGDIVVTAYKPDMTTVYFSNYDSGYTAGHGITATEYAVILKVVGKSSTTGSFAIKAFENEPVINVKRGTTLDISNGSTYNFGYANAAGRPLGFTIYNIGTLDLNLTGSPVVQISGPNASCFSAYDLPVYPIISPGGSAYFTIKFTPDTVGAKVAFVTIANDDTDENPYTFTVTGNGTNDLANSFSAGNWTSGNIATAGQVIIYPFYTTIGQSYAISWDDSVDGTSTYTGDVKVYVYRSDATTTYFSNVNSGFTTPQNITAQDEVIYIMVEGINASATGTFAVRVD